MPRPRWAKKKRQPTRVLTRVIDAFINRKRRDFSTYTTKSLRWLQDKFDALPVTPPIWKRLRKEQRVGLIAGIETRKFAFWYDMGMGKTLLAVALCRYFRRAKVVNRVLVLIPNKINKYEWANDIKTHSPLTKYEILTGSSKSKWEQLAETDALLVLETYGGLVRMLCTAVPGTSKKKPQLVPDKKLVKAMLKNIQGIVMDESIMITHKKGRHGSLMHRLCSHIAKNSEIAYVLNGTPFGSDPTDMWGQFHIIDQGDTLGATLGLFRAVFFNETQNAYGGFDYEFDKTKEALLNQVITNRSIRYEADESTLPGVVSIVKNVPMPQGAREYYEKAKQQIIASTGSYTELKNAFLRMRQISSGYIGYNDDETGDRARFEFETNPKLDMLMSLATSLTKHKMVIFHQFTHSGNMIEQRMREEGIPFARLYGKTKDPDVQLTRFHKDKNCRIFILQNDSGGFGLDRLKVARYGVYFESPVGTVLRVQTGRRIQRQGSDHARVFIYDLVVPDTVDAQIIEAHARGIDLFKAIVDRKAQLK